VNGAPRSPSVSDLFDPAQHGNGGDAGRPDPAEGAPSEEGGGPEANARLTASTAVVLFVLLAAEGVTILRIRALLTPHVFIGMLLVPPILLKIGSTVWRFSRYYLGDPAYRRKGPPPPILRLIGPVVVVLTFAVFGTGIALLLGPRSWRSELLQLHRDTFIVWLAVTAVHVLGHLADTARLAHATGSGAPGIKWTVLAHVSGPLPSAWLLVSSWPLSWCRGSVPGSSSGTVTGYEPRIHHEQRFDGHPKRLDRALIRFQRVRDRRTWRFRLGP